MINSKYVVSEFSFIGKGSYGTVQKGKCRVTGRPVALKIIENRSDIEYDCIKLLREIQLMKKMNQLSQDLERKRSIQFIQDYGGRGTFVPELIDVIIPYGPASDI